MTRGAGCLCGAVRIEITADPIATRQCWCRLCQYLSAGAGTVNAVFAADAVTVTGDVRWYASIADSGNAMQRGFCAACGTPLLSKADARPMHLIVRAGALDDPAIAAPQSAIWVAAAPDWACIDPEIPNLPGQPPPLG